MSLRKGLAAVEARWLWLWQERGSIKLEPLFGTAVLIIKEDAAPSKTYYRAVGDHVVKSARRYFFQRGALLVPRWELLEEHFNPQTDCGLEKSVPSALAAKGMYRLRDGATVILTYQYLSDVFSFWRQQLYIRLETYQDEFKQIGDQLGEIEGRALENIFAKKQEAGLAEELDSLQQDLSARQGDIRAILGRLAERERAAQLLVDAMLEELHLAEIALRAIPKSPVIAELVVRGKPIPYQESVELKRYLTKTYQRLAMVSVRPVSRQVNAAQSRLAEAWGFLGLHDPRGACQRFLLAADNAKKAQEILRAKKEQVRQLETGLVAS